MNNKVEKENTLEPSGEFAASIHDFRLAVEHVAERETARPVPANWLEPARQRRRSHQRRMILGWACAALFCFAMLPFSLHSHSVVVQPAPQAEAAPPPVVDADTTLLEQVDMDVSESVPSSLAPLAELESWNTTSANTSSDSSSNGTALTSTERTNDAH